MKAEVRFFKGNFTTSMDATPHKKCSRCGAGIYFYKTKAGKWVLLEELGCGGDNEQVLVFHKCK